MTVNTDFLEQTNEENEQIAESLLIYPSLEKLFDSDQIQSAIGLKEKMNLTISELERIVLRGTKEEAEKASKIIKAYQITLSFLDELENLRSGQTKE